MCLQIWRNKTELDALLCCLHVGGSDSTANARTESIVVQMDSLSLSLLTDIRWSPKVILGERESLSSRGILSSLCHGGTKLWELSAWWCRGCVLRLSSKPAAHKHSTQHFLNRGSIISAVTRAPLNRYTELLWSCWLLRRPSCTLHAAHCAVAIDTPTAGVLVLFNMAEAAEGEATNGVEGVPEELEVTAPPAAKLSLKVHEIARGAQNQHGLRHSDYHQYRQYCTRRLKRVRSSRQVRFMFGKGKGFVQRV